MSSKKCLTRVSSKSVLPERCAPVSSKGVLQECHLSVSGQGVPQVGSLENVTSLVSVPQHTCRHSGSWVSSCFFDFRPPKNIGRKIVSSGDALFFHYSGHGGREEDRHAASGYVETLCPEETPNPSETHGFFATV